MTYEASALYYKVINDRVRARFGGRYSAPLILHSFNLHLVMGEMNEGKWDAVAAWFTDAAQHMKAAGAEALAICSNYPHKVADEVEVASGMEMLHITDMTAIAVQKSGIRKVGILGMKPAMEEGYVKGRLVEKFGLDVLVPEEQEVRDQVHEEMMSNLPVGKVSDQCRQLLISAAQGLVDRGAEGLILGSTDLAFALKPEDVTVKLFDTNRIHADGIADWINESE